MILAAGEGTRLRPLTSTRPKPMLPIAGKPILEWNLNALCDAGIDRAYIIVGYMGQTIQEYFGKEYNGVKLEYIVQDEQLGTGHAVSMAGKRVGGEFIVLNGDVYVTADTVTEFIETFKKSGSSVCMAVVEVDDPAGYGIVEVSGGSAKSLIEKPDKPKSNLVNAGLYIFTDSVFKVLASIGKSERGEIELTDAVKKYITENDVSVYTIDGDWIDIGVPWDLLSANEKVMKTLKMERGDFTAEDYTTIKGHVGLGDGTLLKSGTYIEGPVVIGKNCRIGPNCYIRPYTAIGDDCVVGNAVEVKNSIIMKGSHLGHLTYVGDSIIGENCNFGAGTKVANLRFDDGQVKVEVKEKFVNSGRRKFGCIMGDNVKTGINVSIMPGRSIYPNAFVSAGSIVMENIHTE